VSRLVPPELALAALLHDAHETYVGDVVRPVKRYLEAHGVNLDDYEGFWQNLIWLKYKCMPMTSAQQELINDADNLQMAREITSLAPEGPFRDYGRVLLNKHAAHKMVTLLEMELCDANPRRDYADFKKRFFELDGGKANG
jgi:5'-deoxynucleotidase YfbR-like HD superfamily hydrolase